MEEDRIHPIADRVEKRVARALGVAFEKMRERIDWGKLQKALDRGDQRMANKVLEAAQFEDALEPVGEILREAMTRGGKAGAEEVNG